MTDKQLAIILREKAIILKSIAKHMEDELLKSKKFRRYYKSPFRAGEVPYVPLLADLESYINSLYEQAQTLEEVDNG
jgi:hypothetical protein